MRFRFGRRAKTLHMPKQTIYVASDGNYGDAHRLALVDISDWTEADWEELDCARDGDRADVAVTITTNKKGK